MPSYFQIRAERSHIADNDDRGIGDVHALRIRNNVRKSRA